VARGTLRSVIARAGITVEEFLEEVVGVGRRFIKIEIMYKM